MALLLPEPDPGVTRGDRELPGGDARVDGGIRHSGSFAAGEAARIEGLMVTWLKKMTVTVGFLCTSQRF